MGWLIPLFISHLVPYILIPSVMWIFHKRRDYYSGKINSYLLIQIGLLMLIFAMVVEFSWHHFIQGWNYTNSSHFLNGLMYTFMNLGFAFMIFGFKREKLMDVIIAISVVVTPLSYFMGLKQPIWLAQTLLVAILVYVAYKVLDDKRIILFPVFSFGVNMLFITLLLSTGNPLYHILHDLLGTLFGFAIFGYLVWINPELDEYRSLKENKQQVRVGS